MNLVVDPVEQALADGATADAVLDLVDVEIDAACVRGDDARLEVLASLLQAAAVERGEGWGGLAIAAARARARMTGGGASQPVGAEPPRAAPAPTVEDMSEAAAPTVYAGWWRRTGAFAVDVVVVMFGYALLGGAAGDSDSTVFAVVSLALPFSYFAGLHALADGVTAGKGLFGIAVRSSVGGHPGFGRAAVRAVATAVLWITVIGGFIDAIVGASSHRRQWVHDMIADTVVVCTRG